MQKNSISRTSRRLFIYFLVIALVLSTAFVAIPAKADAAQGVPAADATNAPSASETSTPTIDPEGNSVPSVSPLAHAHTFSISGATVVPDPLHAGTGVAVKGTVKSHYVIKSVSAKITNSSGKAIYQTSIKLGKVNSYNISAFDSAIKFSKLGVGSYTYVVTVTDIYDYSGQVQRSGFAVANSSYSLTGSIASQTIMQGKGLTVIGTVSSKFPLNKVTAQIVNSSGKAVYTATASGINATTYKLNKFDSKLLFSRLYPGKYTYVVYAQDKYSSSAYKFATKPITVKAVTFSTISPTNCRFLRG